MQYKHIFDLFRDPERRNVLTDPVHISNVLNSHFASVRPKLASAMPQSKKDFCKYLPGSVPFSSFFLDLVMPDEIQSEIFSLSIKKAHGLHSFLVKIFKYGSSILSNPLASIMNLSIQNSIYPSELKHAKIVPVYKYGDDLAPGNYGPISLLSNINRIFKKLVYNRVNNFIAKHKILCPSQYGFRKN